MKCKMEKKMLDSNAHRIYLNRAFGVKLSKEFDAEYSISRARNNDESHRLLWGMVGCTK
jgi:hypothetical protein